MIRPKNNEKDGSYLGPWLWRRRVLTVERDRNLPLGLQQEARFF
jgi:hypothetical protein